MAILKCKSCGQPLNLFGTETVVECEYCGLKQTVPTADDEKKIALFSRANDLRLAYEFDKAAGVYEAIVGDFPEEAEAYWGLVLCKYGIEYVDDVVTDKKVPTCHRLRPTPIIEDADYLRTIENADIVAKDTYRQSAEEINDIQKQILSIALKEKPYDIFICFKDKDENGDRTEDSSIAQDIYTELTREGYKVFFSRVTLRSHAGTEYEPYIYAALSSAKVLLSLGTKFEYFDAVWVKNEWSRFISMMRTDKTKTVIPCYKDMDIDDMPKEFRNMQALDMGNVMFFNDLLENVKRVVGTKKHVASSATSATNTATVDSLVKRIFMFLEDGDFNSANSYCEKVLDIDPENALAYLGKLMAQRKAKKRSELNYQKDDLNKAIDFIKAVKFADEALKAELLSYRNESIYNHGSEIILSANENTGKGYESIIKIKEQYKMASDTLSPIIDYKDVKSKLSDCEKTLMEKALNCAYSIKEKLVVTRSESDFEQASELFNFASNEAQKDINAMIIAFGDSVVNAAKAYSDFDRATNIYSRAKDCEEANEKIKICKEKQTEFYNNSRYSTAMGLKRKDTIDSVQEAITVLTSLKGYRDSDEQSKILVERKDLLIKEADYSQAISNMNSNKIEILNQSKKLLLKGPDYKDSRIKIEKCEQEIKRLTKIENKKKRKKAFIDGLDSFGMKWLYWLATTALFALVGYWASLEIPTDVISVEGTTALESDFQFYYYDIFSHIIFAALPIVLSVVWSILKKRYLWIWGLIGAIVFGIVSIVVLPMKTIFIVNCVYAAISYLSCWIAICMDRDDKWDLSSGGSSYSSSSSSCSCNGSGGCY